MLEKTLHVATIGVVSLLPLVVFAWVAVDNAVFLFAPVRFVPGQEGAVQNAGRGLILMMFRFLLVGVGTTLAVTAYFAGEMLATDVFGASEPGARALGAFWVWTSLFFIDAVLVWIGAWCLRRFDVAADR